LDPHFSDGLYKEQPIRGMRAAARIFAGWGLSHQLYREQTDIKQLGFASIEDFLVGFWEG
jgi:homoserine O-acetyltransferase